MFKFLSSEPVHDATASSTADTEVKTTTCYMCACRCGIRVHLRDGQVRYIDGNPDHPINKGVICAKGSAGIMKQVSPARLTQPLLRRPGSERGEGEFEPISWERAYELLTERLGRIRATDPKKFALFTGRDQMQALTGLFARQFGTPNYAAHGGFCSVNMAAGMIYSVGGSFWEFGGPDLDRAKLFVMIGTAEDHHSNPMKIALGDFKRKGGRFISINPVRTGYSAIADEWIPIRPGTDGALFMALLHELLAQGLVDRSFLQRFTNAPQLVVLDEGEREGLFAFDPAAGPPGDGRHPHNKLAWDLASGRVVQAYPEGDRGRAGAGTGRPLQAGGRHARGAGVPAVCETALQTTTPGVGRDHYRHSRSAHPQVGPGAWANSAAPGLRAAHSLDGRVGQAP
jgi:anaerobic selenocysteine-containing dehydrogenase